MWGLSHPGCGVRRRAFALSCLGVRFLICSYVDNHSQLTQHFSDWEMLYIVPGRHGHSITR